MPSTSQTLATLGWETAIGIAVESTAGTAVSPSVYLPVSDFNVSQKNNLAPRTLVRRTKGQVISAPGQATVTGDFTTEFHPTEIGKLIGLGMGADTVTGSPNYTHTFSLASPLNTFTLSADYLTGTIHQFAGCKVDSMEISGKGKAPIMAKWSIVGMQDSVTSGSLSPTYNQVTALPYTFEMITAATINGVTLFATDFQITLKNNIKPTWYSGSGRIAGEMNETNAMVTGQMNVQATDEQIYNMMLNVTTVPVVLSFTHPTTSYTLALTLNTCIIDQAPIAIQQNNINMYAVKFEAFESAPGANDNIQIAYKNNVQSSTYITTG